MGTQGVLWDSLKFFNGIELTVYFRKHLVLYEEPCPNNLLKVLTHADCVVLRKKSRENLGIHPSSGIMS